MALKTYYAVVAQYDSLPGSAFGASGPLLFERSLDNDSALSEAQTREIAEAWERSGRHGWCRVATVTIDIPE